MDYQKILSHLDYICQTYEDINLVREIINSVNKNQLASKSWLVDKCESYFESVSKPKVLVAAGWFGLLGHLIKQKHDADVVSFDMDPTCAEIGKMLFPEVEYESNFIENQLASGFDFVICTSCEHMEDDTINEWISTRDKNSIVVLQSNNYYEIEEHINCKDSLEHFCSSYHLNIIESMELEREKYNRFMLVGS